MHRNSTVYSANGFIGWLKQFVFVVEEWAAYWHCQMSIDSKPVLPECVVKCLDKLKKNDFLYCTWVGCKFYNTHMICDFIRSVKPSIRYNRIFAFNAEVFFDKENF